MRGLSIKEHLLPLRLQWKRLKRMEILITKETGISKFPFQTKIEVSNKVGQILINAGFAEEVSTVKKEKKGKVND